MPAFVVAVVAVVVVVGDSQRHETTTSTTSTGLRDVSEVAAWSAGKMCMVARDAEVFSSHLAAGVQADEVVQQSLALRALRKRRGSLLLVADVPGRSRPLP